MFGPTLTIPADTTCLAIAVLLRLLEMLPCGLRRLWDGAPPRSLCPVTCGHSAYAYPYGWPPRECRESDEGGANRTHLAEKSVSLDTLAFEWTWCLALRCAWCVHAAGHTTILEHSYNFLAYPRTHTQQSTINMQRRCNARTHLDTLYDTRLAPRLGASRTKSSEQGGD